jgi:septal ring factor EnvC (AmiA/AmiB activator)
MVALAPLSKKDGDSTGKMKRMLVIGILLAGTFYPVTGPLWAAQADRVEKELADKKEELKRIKRRLRGKRKEGNHLLRKETSIRKRLTRAQEDLHTRERTLKRKRAGLDRVKGRMRDTENRMSVLTRDVKRTEEQLGSGLHVLYKMSQVGPEAHFFSKRSFADLLNMEKYLLVLVDRHAQALEEYRDELALKRGDRRKLVTARTQIRQAISKEEAKKERIRKVRNTEQARLRTTLGEKRYWQNSITEMEKRSRSIQSLIERLSRERRALSYGKSGYGKFKGKLQWPVQGKVVSLFKQRGRNGIEIEASAGAPVRAVLPGKVLYADWFKGFDNLIIIDHGGGIFSVSGNCSRLAKKRGDAVSVGEVIAWMGDLKSGQAPSLYFEIRDRGKPRDPLGWVSGSR